MSDPLIHLPPGEWPFTPSQLSIPLPKDFKIQAGSKMIFKISGPQAEDFFRYWDLIINKEHTPVGNANKQYKVILVNGTERDIEANEYAEQDGRVKFYGPVTGYDHSMHGARELVASFLTDQVLEFGLVPVTEQTKDGAYTFQVTLTDETVHTVQADKVLHKSVGTDKGGHYVLGTDLANGQMRTEYVVPEELLSTILRVSDETKNSDVNVPAPTKGLSDIADATA